MNRVFVISSVFLISQPAFTQDQNLLRTIIREPGSGFTNMFLVGTELSTVPIIDPKSADSSGTGIYAMLYLNYQHKSNAGLLMESSAIPNGSNAGPFLTAITPYYANYENKISPYVSYTRYIDHKNKAIPYSPIQNDIYAQVRMRFRILQPIAGANLGFGNDIQNGNKRVTDVIAFVALSKSWSIVRKQGDQVLAILPTMQLNAGTDRYFKFVRSTKYISQNQNLQAVKGKSTQQKGKQQQAGQPATTIVEYEIHEENEFELSNLEFNLYCMYFIGSFSIEPSGSLFFHIRSESQLMSGYWQLNVNYWFR